ncbi:MAG: hypothetical protein JNL05_00525 [Flavobacteriales bacterium]|nr:hypothetical protein [Flavobacteriales bacterium]
MIYTNENLQAIIQWMGSGGVLDLPPKQKELFMRAQLAYQLVLEYRSDKVALQHMKAHYGAAYSESTCRRDLHAAKTLFGYRDPGTWEFTSGMVIDWALEMMVKAQKAGDIKGWSQVAMVLYKFGGGDKAHERPFDPATLNNPVPREIVFDPRLVGAKDDPQLMEKLVALLGEKRMKGVHIPELPAADYEELPRPDETPG